MLALYAVTVLVMRNIVFLMAWYLDLWQNMLYWIIGSVNVRSFDKMHDKLHAGKWECGSSCPNMPLHMPLTVTNNCDGCGFLEHLELFVE